MAKSSRTPKSAQKPLLSGLCAEAGLPELNGSIVGPLGNYERYPLVNSHSYWKWPFIVDLPIKNDDFP